MPLLISYYPCYRFLFPFLAFFLSNLYTQPLELLAFFELLFEELWINKIALYLRKDVSKLLKKMEGLEMKFQKVENKDKPPRATCGAKHWIWK